jgi:hypothetical protein
VTKFAIPPVIGRFYCGWHNLQIALKAYGGRPAVIGGLHCGYSQSRPYTSGSRVIPPVLGGLYLRQQRVGQRVRPPAGDRRAPLRRARLDQPPIPDGESSRRSPVGSIAARSPGPR